MPTRARLVASLTRFAGASADHHWPAEFPGVEVTWALEWRADLLGDPHAGVAGVLSGRRSIYTLRSRAEGGEGPDDAAERRRRLLAAARDHDLVDLEADRDLDTDLLDKIPAEKRIVSWHGPGIDLAGLRRRFARMAETPARFYKLVPAAAAPRDALEPLALLSALQRGDVISFASGEAGTWSRLLAPRLGAPVVFGHAQGEPAAAGQLALADLRRDYGLPEMPRISKLFGVAGRPVLHSLSPRLHNLMYRRLGLERLYVPFHVPMFGDFWLDVVESGGLDRLGFELCGLSVTAPFKEIALAVAGAASPRAERIGAANSLAKRGRVWEADCTDPEGVLAPLRARAVELEGASVAVVGAGGAGRAALAGLSSAGATVTLLNRTLNRGRRVATEMGVEFVPLDRLEPARFRVLVNATPLGAAGGELPFDPEQLDREAIVVDLAYRHDGETDLVRATRASGRIAVDGKEVLLYQAAPQFEWLNGHEFEIDAARAELDLDGGAAR